MKTMADEEFYTLQEVADRLKVTYRTVYRWVQENRLPAYQIGAGSWRVRKEDLEEFLQDRKTGGRTGA